MGQGWLSKTWLRRGRQAAIRHIFSNWEFEKLDEVQEALAVSPQIFGDASKEVNEKGGNASLLNAECRCR